MLNFLSLQEISKNQLDSSLIGGKAKALAQLYQNYFLVPDGFVITTEFFNLLLKDDAISEKDLEIIFKYIDLCSPLGFVAVRSSASVEDSNEQSFAGQFETVLNVKKEDDVDFGIFEGLVEKEVNRVRVAMKYKKNL
jgi:pyruvate,water dikinase